MDIDKTAKDINSLKELMYEAAYESPYPMSVRVEAAQAFALLTIAENINAKKIKE
jgi:hypothetical protein